MSVLRQVATQEILRVLGDGATRSAYTLCAAVGTTDATEQDFVVAVANAMVRKGQIRFTGSEYGAIPTPVRAAVESP